MKSKLTVTVDRSMIEFGKQYASRRGTSLSQVIEDALRRIARFEQPSFSRKWRGRFSKSARRGDERMRHLENRYG